MSICEAVWGGTLLVEIYVSEPEALVERRYLAKMHRVAYWPQYLPEILAYFNRYLSRSLEQQPWDWWLEYDNSPIPWNEPVGLIFDRSLAAPKFPWRLSLRRADGRVPYPSSLLALENEFNVRNFWLNQSKEACYIRDGNSNAIMNLSRENIQDLWRAIRNGSYETFWTICGPFVREQNLKHVPIRVYLDDGRVVQKLVDPIRDNGCPQLVETALFSLNLDSSDNSFYLHGAEVPLYAPLLELYMQAMYPDGFLHIVMTRERIYT